MSSAKASNKDIVKKYIEKGSFYIYPQICYFIPQYNQFSITYGLYHLDIASDLLWFFLNPKS